MQFLITPLVGNRTLPLDTKKHELGGNDLTLVLYIFQATFVACCSCLCLCLCLLPAMRMNFPEIDVAQCV